MNTTRELHDLDLERVTAGKDLLTGRSSGQPTRLPLGSGFLAGRGPDAGPEMVDIPPLFDTTFFTGR